MKQYHGQTVREIPLNCLDRYMVAAENEDFHANCHYFLDFDNPVDVNRIRSTVAALFRELPMCRSFVVQTKSKFLRLSTEKPWFNTDDYVEVYDKADPVRDDAYIQRAFDLQKEPPLRFLWTPTIEGKWRLIITGHHSAFDGLGLGVLFQEFFSVWDGNPVSKELNTYKSFRYRMLAMGKGAVWFVGRILQFVRPFSRTNRRVNATLLSDPGNPRREMSIRFVDLSSKELVRLRKHMTARLGAEHLKMLEYLTFCAFRVMNRMIAETGDSERPITFLLPMNLRPNFRFRKIFQNIVGMMWIAFERTDITTPGFFEAMRKQILEKSRLEETMRLPFFFGFFSTVLSPTKLRAALKKSDQDPNCIFNTLMIRAGRLPGTFKFPKEFQIHRIAGHSGMTKTPGICLSLVGPRDRQTISIEWLRYLVPEERMIRFENELIKELWSSEV